MSYFSRTDILCFSKRYILEFTKKKFIPKIAYFTQYFNSNSKCRKIQKKKNLILETG